MEVWEISIPPIEPSNSIPVPHVYVYSDTVCPLKKFGCFNLYAPNIQIQILQTDLHTFHYKISWENLITMFSLWWLFY